MPHEFRVSRGSLALSSGAGNSLWIDAGLEICVEGPEGQRQIVVDKPFARLGAHPAAEVRFRTDALAVRHVYLHATEHGVFCCPVTSVTQFGEPCRGWLAPDQWFAMGEYRVRVRTTGTSPDNGRTPLGLDEKDPAPKHLPVVAVLFDGHRVTRRVLGRRLTVVGRRWPSALRIGSPALSTCHAALYWDDRELWAVDLLSRVGTWIDGETFEATRVPVGTHLRIGEVEIEYLGTTMSHSVDGEESDVGRAAIDEARRRALEEAARQAAQLERDRNANQALRTELAQQAAVLEAQRKATEQARRECDATLSRLEQQRQQAAAQHATLQAERALVETQRIALAEEQAALAIQNAALAQERSLLETDRATLEADRATLQTDRATLQTDRAALAVEHGRLAEAEGEIARRQAELAALEKALADRRRSLEAGERDLQERLGELRTRAREVQKREAAIEDRTREVPIPERAPSTRPIEAIPEDVAVASRPPAAVPAPLDSFEPYEHLSQRLFATTRARTGRWWHWKRLFGGGSVDGPDHDDR